MVVTIMSETIAVLSAQADLVISIEQFNQLTVFDLEEWNWDIEKDKAYLFLKNQSLEDWEKQTWVEFIQWKLDSL